MQASAGVPAGPAEAAPREWTPGERAAGAGLAGRLVAPLAPAPEPAAAVPAFPPAAVARSVPWGRLVWPAWSVAAPAVLLAVPGREASAEALARVLLPVASAARARLSTAWGSMAGLEQRAPVPAAAVLPAAPRAAPATRLSAEPKVRASPPAAVPAPDAAAVFPDEFPTLVRVWQQAQVPRSTKRTWPRVPRRRLAWPRSGRRRQPAPVPRPGQRGPPGEPMWRRWTAPRDAVPAWPAWRAPGHLSAVAWTARDPAPAPAGRLPASVLGKVSRWEHAARRAGQRLPAAMVPAGRVEGRDPAAEAARRAAVLGAGAAARRAAAD